MWTEASALFEAMRAELRRQGTLLRAEVARADLSYCWYQQGVVHLSLPDPREAGGRLRYTLLGALLGLEADELAELTTALLPRIVAHEIGHALRDEQGMASADPVVEEQGADAIAGPLSAPWLDPAAMPRVKALLHRSVAHTGMLPCAAALHRDPAARRRAPPPDPALRDLVVRRFRAGPPAHFRERLLVQHAWTWLDLT